MRGVTLVEPSVYFPSRHSLEDITPLEGQRS